MSDVQIPPVLLSFVIAWFMRAINVLKTKGQDLTVDKMEELLTNTLGNAITFGMLKGLDGNDLLDELRAIGVMVPRTAAKVFTAFVQAWTVTTPRCDNVNCQMLGININPSKNGVESIVEGTRCSWCEGRGIVRSTKMSLTFMAWTTGLQVDNELKVDRNTHPGFDFLLQEGDLRARTDATLLAALDKEGVTVITWLRYLLAHGDDYDITQRPLPVYRSLKDEAHRLTGLGSIPLSSAILAAKREGERKQMEVVPAARPASPSTGGDATMPLVYVIATHAERAAVDRLRKHMTRSASVVASFEAPAGAATLDWQSRTASSAKLIVVFVSADLLADDDGAYSHAEHALRLGKSLIPVILRPCDFPGSSLAGYHPANRKPPKDDEDWMEIARSIKGGLSSGTGGGGSSPSSGRPLDAYDYYNK